MRPPGLVDTYTLIAVAAGRPQYVDAAPYPQRPRGHGTLFQRVGQHRWVLGASIDRAMRGHRLWNLGIRIGNTLHVIVVRVVR